MKNLLKRSATRGFTLVELIIVIVIIGILAAIAVPQFTSVSGNARASADKATAAALGSASAAAVANGTTVACTLAGAGTLVTPNVASPATISSATTSTTLANGTGFNCQYDADGAGPDSVAYGFFIP